MLNDPIVAEVRRIREAYAAKFNYDLEAMVKGLRKQQEKSGRKVVSLKPRKPADRGSTAA